MNGTDRSDKLTVRLWLHGLAAAFIGGGSGAVSAGLGALLADPDHFNPANGGLTRILTVMSSTFLVSGILSVTAYLKQSPVPDWDGSERRNGEQKESAEKDKVIGNLP